MKKLLIALCMLSLIPSIPLTSFGSDHLCKNKIDRNLVPTDKAEVLSNITSDNTNYTELEDVEYNWVVHLLKKKSSETYTLFDYEDAGYYVAIVSKIDCAILWDGFLFHY